MQSGLILITWESGDFFFFCWWIISWQVLPGCWRHQEVCVCVTGLSPAWHAQATASRGAEGVAQIVWAKGCGVDVPALCACEGFFLWRLWDRAWPSVDYSDWICLCTLNEEQQSCKVDVKFSFPDHAIRQKTLWNVLSSYFPHSETSGTGSPKSLWVVNEASKETRARWLIGLQVVTFWRKWRGKFHFLHRLSQESTWVVSAVALHTACLMV